MFELACFRSSQQAPFSKKILFDIEIGVLQIFVKELSFIAPTALLKLKYFIRKIIWKYISNS